jgi:hypothetical protein
MEIVGLGPKNDVLEEVQATEKGKKRKAFQIISNGD